MLPKIFILLKRWIYFCIVDFQKSFTVPLKCWIYCWNAEGGSRSSIISWFWLPLPIRSKCFRSNSLWVAVANIIFWKWKSLLELLYHFICGVFGSAKKNSRSSVILWVWLPLPIRSKPSSKPPYTPHHHQWWHHHQRLSDHLSLTTGHFFYLAYFCLVFRV